MKHTIKIIIAAIALITLCSAGFNKPSKVQRRKGVLSVDAAGKVTFTPLEDWKDYTPISDTVYQFKQSKS